MKPDPSVSAAQVRLNRLKPPIRSRGTRECAGNCGRLVSSNAEFGMCRACAAAKLHSETLQRLNQMGIITSVTGVSPDINFTWDPLVETGDAFFARVERELKAVL